MENFVENLASKIGKFPKVKKVILFGSRARGDAKERSDVDLAIECSDITDKEWLDIKIMVDDIETLLFVDVVLLDTASDDLKSRVLREGKILYEC